MMGGGSRAVGGAASVSFEEFYRAEYASVVRLAFVLTGRRDIAEELAQDAFLAAHRRWGRVSTYESPAGWVRRVVTHRSVSAGRRHLTELRLLARLGRERPADPSIPLEAAELLSMVRDLPRRQAQVVALAFVEDRTIGEIAEILGCGEVSVRTHLRRGRAVLTHRLSTEGSIDE